MIREEYKKQFKKALLKIGIALNANMSNEEIEVYWEVLRNEFKDYNEFRLAAYNVLKKYKVKNTFPPIAEFLNNKPDSKRPCEKLALKTWNLIIKALANGAGSVARVHSNDSIMIYVVDVYMGGFSSLSTKTYKELDFMKKQYIERYCEVFETDEVKRAILYKPNNYNFEKTIKIVVTDEELNLLIEKKKKAIKPLLDEVKSLEHLQE